MKALFQKYKMLIPILVLAGLCMFTVATFIRGTVDMNGFEYEFMLTVKHYGAFVSVMVNLVSFFVFRKYFKYIFILTLLLGLFSIINFTPLDTQWMLRAGSILIEIQPTAFLVGILTIVLNFKTIEKGAFQIVA